MMKKSLVLLVGSLIGTSAMACLGGVKIVDDITIQAQRVQSNMESIILPRKEAFSKETLTSSGGSVVAYLGSIYDFGSIANAQCWSDIGVMRSTVLVKNLTNQKSTVYILEKKSVPINNDTWLTAQGVKDRTGAVYSYTQFKTGTAMNLNDLAKKPTHQIVYLGSWAKSISPELLARCGAPQIIASSFKISKTNIATEYSIVNSNYIGNGMATRSIGTTPAAPVKSNLIPGLEIYSCK
jgi:hypothetical protein